MKKLTQLVCQSQKCETSVVLGSDFKIQKKNHDG